MKFPDLHPVVIGTVTTLAGLRALARKTLAADAVEVRVDTLLKEKLPVEKIETALKARQHPVLLTLRIPAEGGHRAWKIPERRDLFPGALEIMILKSLRLKPMHGYALVKHIKLVSDDLLEVEEGSLYPALQRMLREGWLEAETGTSAKGRPTRIYRVTDAGIRHLDKEVLSFEKMFAGITRVLAVTEA